MHPIISKAIVAFFFSFPLYFPSEPGSRISLYTEGYKIFLQHCITQGSTREVKCIKKCFLTKKMRFCNK